MCLVLEKNVHVMPFILVTVLSHVHMYIHHINVLNVVNVRSRQHRSEQCTPKV